MISLVRSWPRTLGIAGATVVAIVLAMADPAAATWSIVAVDDDSGDVGVAIASCVPYDVIGNPDEAAVPVVLDPGRAAAVTQAQFDIEARPLAFAGSSPPMSGPPPSSGN